jgi:hypothetical protein
MSDPTEKPEAHRKRERVWVERGIVSRMLGEDRERGFTRAEMQRELNDLQYGDVNAALKHLSEVGVITLDGEAASLSQCTTYLDRIGVVGM